MRDSKTFRNRTRDADIIDLRLPQNDFWLQTQSLLAGFLQALDYREALYVPVLRGEGKTLSDEILDYLKVEGRQYFLLIGNYGVGKSSVLGDVHRRLSIDNDHSPTCWMYFDGNEGLTEVVGRTSVLMQKMGTVAARAVQDYLKLNRLSHTDFQRDLFENDTEFEVARLINPLFEAHGDYVVEVLRDPLRMLTVTLRFLARVYGRGKVVLVLDNLDGLGHDAQLAGVLAAQSISLGCGVKVIVSIRRETERRLRYHQDQVFEPYLQIQVSPPNMLEVIRVRISQALEQPEAQQVTLGSGALRAKVSESPEFAEVLKRGLAGVKVSSMLHAMSNSSVREALHFAMHVYSGPYLDARRIIRKLSPADAVAPTIWGHIPYYVVIKSLLLRTQQVYRPEISWIGNLFGTSNPNHHANPFLRLYILCFLETKGAQQCSSDDLTAEIDMMLRIGNTPIEDELRWLEDAKFVDRWRVNQKMDVLQLTARGSYAVRHLLFDADYLTHIATDVRMYPEFASQLAFPADNTKQRMHNLCLLVEFLVYRERELWGHLSKNGPVIGLLDAIGGRLPSIAILDTLQTELRKSDSDSENKKEEVMSSAGERLRSFAASNAVNDLRKFVAS